MFVFCIHIFQNKIIFVKKSDEIIIISENLFILR